ncbi:MAG: hypothetical protein ACR2NP_10645 [Pirellulaceae bacterium]
MIKFPSDHRVVSRICNAAVIAVLLVCSWTCGIAIAAPQPEPEGDDRPAARQPVQPTRVEAAWEYRPYRVIIWLAHNDSWRLKSFESSLIDGLSRQALLADPSAWRVRIERAPNPWNWRLLGDVDRSRLSDDLHLAAMSVDPDVTTDKLIVVNIEDDSGMFATTVQELDLRTKIWGAKVKRRSDLSNLQRTIFNSIRTAFMPVTRIETVRDNDVRVRVRASSIASIIEEDEEGVRQLVPNTGSPAWISEDEILLPVMLRSDRRGNLESITPVQWTFLSILGRDGPHMDCTTHAMRRAPLGGRTGGRIERIGLCVRAPLRPTRLRLISNDQLQTPLADLKILSRGPGWAEGEESEVLGKTDWRGEIMVPPNEDGIRILGIFSGTRPLARVPMVPGLYDVQVTSMPNDESRLYAEGIVRGLQNELMDNLARRQVLTAQVEMAMEKSDFERAEDLLKEMRDVPDSRKFNIRLTSERQELLRKEKDRLSNDDRQQGYIMAMFEELMLASSRFLDSAKETELSRMVRDARNAR